MCPSRRIGEAANIKSIHWRLIGSGVRHLGVCDANPSERTQPGLEDPAPRRKHSNEYITWVGGFCGIMRFPMIGASGASGREAIAEQNPTLDPNWTPGRHFADTEIALSL